mgnify:CR=1 FL=1
MSEPQTQSFQAEVRQLLDIVIHSLYTDKEIFVRELISNASDSLEKLRLKELTEKGIYQGDLPLEINIATDEEAGTITITDHGIGMTSDELTDNLGTIARSGSKEFLEALKEKGDANASVIGQFGVGFYSAFMVSEKVEIITKSHKDSPATHWTCDGSPEYTLEASDKENRGTEIILHIDKDSKEFLEESRIRELLQKYNKFMSIPIQFGTREESLPLPEDADKDAKPETITVPNIINNSKPAWTKKPADLEEKDYQSFYRELYPMQFEEPLFNIHLNVDYPFNLTGILYFPKLKNDLNIQKDRIQLYQNQVFVTDNVEGIVPEFLTLLRGVIDSPDIPLNVSRSYLQADGAVKKISNYITRKVADKLNSLFKKDRKGFEEKWNDIKVVINCAGYTAVDKAEEKTDVPETQAAPEKTSEETSTEAVVPNNES